MICRPALTAAGLLVTGIYLHSVVWRSSVVWLIVLVTLVVVAFLLKHKAGWVTMIIAAALIVAGTLLGQIANYQFRTNDIAQFATEEPRLTWLELRFDESPQISEDSSLRGLPGKQIGHATVVRVRTTKGWEKSTGDILFSLSQTDPRIPAGQRVRVVGMLQRLNPAANPGEFDWQRYCRTQSVLTSIRVNHACDVELISAGVSSTFAEARVGVRDWLALGFPSDHAVDCALLQALLLGDRGSEIHGIERDFQKTGTSHLLSSSGVRMAVLAGMIYFFCRLLRVRPRTAGLIVAISIVGWGCVTMSSPQALRPVIVAAALGLGFASRRTVDPLQLLAFAAIAILVFQPLDIYGAGFQFSFIIVMGMLIFTRPFTTFLAGFYNRDIEVLHRFGKLTPAQRVRRLIVHRMVQVFAVTAVAWIVSVPLVASQFEQFTPWAMPISIVLSPVVCAVLLGGFVKFVATMLIPSLAPTWAMMAAWPVELLRHAIGWAGHLPLADVPIAPPPIWEILLFYGLLCLPLFPTNRKVIRFGLRCGPAAACALILLLPSLCVFVGQSTSPTAIRVTLLSIGAGQCGVVEPPGGSAMMVDAGSSTVADPLHQCIGPFLHHEGKTSLSTIYLSHGDYDHISATAGALEEYGLEQVITTPFFRKHAAESPTCRHLLELLDGTGHPPREIVAGQTFDWGGGATAEVLWPTKQCDMNSNNAGMVIRLTFGGKSILFPADIQDPAMYELLKTPTKLRSDVLVAAHHGSSESLTAAFVRAVNPEVIVSSDASRLTKKQRDFEQMIDHRPLYRTGHCGAITIEIDKNGRLKVTPFLTRKQHGIIVERDGSVHPAP